MSQPATRRCDCGGVIVLQATRSPWEFEGDCQTCKGGVIVSWAHKSPPPRFEAPAQGALPLEFSA